MVRTLLICTTLALAACAGTPATPTAQNGVAGNATPNTNCITSASRIPQNGCNTFGRTYTQDDIDRTGKTDPGQALQMLDPSISVHH
jgi:hypothetical protein